MRLGSRYLRGNGKYENILCRNEFRLRSKRRRAIPYQCLAKFGTVSEFFRRAFARPTPFWQSLEVSCACAVQLPPVLIYRVLQLMDTESPWWVVACTELSAKMAASIFFEVYDTCRLLALSREMMQGIRHLSLRRWWVTWLMRVSVCSSSMPLNILVSWTSDMRGCVAACFRVLLVVASMAS